MQVFIQVNVDNTPAFTYQRPLLPWLKARAPETAVLDIDSFSDEILVSQAGRLVREAALYVVYFKVAAPDAPLGTAFKLLEEIIREDKPGLILLEGHHARLSAILQARKHLLLIPVQSPEAVKPHLTTCFNLATAPG